MTITNKFLSLLNFSNDNKKEHELFNALLDGALLAPLNKMLEAGFILNPRNFEKFIFFIERVSTTQDNEDAKQRVKQFIKLIIDSVTRGQEKGIHYFNDDYKNLKSLNFEETGRQLNLVNFFKYCTSINVFNSSDIIDQIKYKSNFDDSINNLKHTWPYNEIISEDIHLSRLSSDMQNGIDSGLSVVLKSISSREKINVTNQKLNNLIQSNIDPVLAKQIASLEARVSQFYLANPNVEIQDKLLIDRILEEDIPKLLSSAALLPKDVQEEYKNSAGVSVKTALVSLIEKYEATMNEIIERVTSVAAQSIHKEIQINTKYINKIRQATGSPSFEDNTPATPVKTIKLA